MNRAHLNDLIYPARTFAQTIAVIIVANSVTLSAAMQALLVGLLLYPHVCYLMGLYWLKEINWIRWLLVIDAFWVSALVAFTPLLFIPVLALLGAMLMTALMTLKPGSVLARVIYLSLMTALLIAIPRILHSAAALSRADFFALLLLLGYGGYLVGLGFSETRLLGIRQKVSSRLHARKASSNQLMQPYLPSQLVTQLKSVEQHSVASMQRLYVTIFFSDISGFTRLSELTDESELIELLIEYFNVMSRITLHHGGTLDKFTGDGLMVIFGAPQEIPAQQGIDRCVKMALEMRSKWFELRRIWVDRGIVLPIGLRMGIHSGFCVLGSFGCMDRLQYTAFGSVVNLASRLEGLAEDDEILVSSSSWTMLGGKYAGVAREAATVPGLSRPVHAVRVQG